MTWRARRRAGVIAAVLCVGAAARAQSPASGTDAAAPRPGIRQLSAVVQQRLQLTDEQTARLRETSQRYAGQRKGLLRDERAARRTVRDEVGRGNAADQTRVQGALDRLYAIQQRRSELAASEQRELAGFLTPTQRAQYAGMQERAFRAAQDIRRRRGAAVDAPRPAGPDPARAAQNAERPPEQAQRQAQHEVEQAARRAAHAAGRSPY